MTTSAEDHHTHPEQDPVAAPSSAEPSLSSRGPVDPGSSNTRRAYASDWKHFAAWCRREGLPPLPADPEVISRYIRACASGAGRRDGKANSLSTIERRLSSLSWNCAQRGFALDRKDEAIAAALADVRSTGEMPARRKQALSPKELAAMLETLDRGTLKGLRDRAILLLGFSGGLRRSEITGLDAGPDQSNDGRGWITLGPAGATITLAGRTGLREIEIARAASEPSCPFAALEAWMRLGKIAKGPVFRRVLRGGKTVGKARLHDQEVARLVKRTALAAGLPGTQAAGSLAGQFSSQSLRPGPTSKPF